MYPTHQARRSRLALGLIGILSLCAVAQAQSAPSWKDLDDFVTSSMKDWHCPGIAIAVVQGDSVPYAKGFGVRNVDTGAPVTADTLFDIGSATKAFTSAAIAMLVDEHKMQWDEKVNHAIPFFHLHDPLVDENITIRDLLTHRTGIQVSDAIWYGSRFNREEIIRRLAFVDDFAGFRDKFEYQNSMYIVAGYAAGMVSGGTWEDLVRRRIFTPLGMNTSDMSAVDVQKAADFATPHIIDETGKAKTIPWRNIDVAGPAGSINSSVREMTNWISMQLNDGVFHGTRLISEASMKEMHRPQIVIPPGHIPTVFFPDSMQLSYGLGWFVQDYRGHQILLHPGDIDGFSALVALIPEIHSGYVVLCNIGGISYRQAVGYHIADALLHLPAENWSARFQALDERAKAAARSQDWESKRIPNTHPSRPLPDYVATYRNPVFGDVKITTAGDQLHVDFQMLSSDLQHFHLDTFVTPPDRRRTRVTFDLDANGTPTELTMSGIRFKRIKS